jgi:DNA segregation ATPase FtsK/SpoIIIE, S-DNA-T family
LAAEKNTRKSSSSQRTGNRSKSSGTRKKTANSRNVHKSKRKDPVKDMYKDEIALVSSLVLSLLLILSNFDLSGIVGKWINSFTFGMFGFLAYLLPFFLFFSVAFGIANRGNRTASVKLVTSISITVVLAAILQLLKLTTGNGEKMSLTEIYRISYHEKNGGGLIGGLLLNLLYPLFGAVGSYVVLFGIMVVLIVIFTGKSIFKPLGAKSEAALMQMKEMKRIRQEAALEVDDEEEEAPEPKRKARIISFSKDKAQNERNEEIVKGTKEDEEPSVTKQKQSRKKKNAEQNKEEVEMQEITPVTVTDFPIQQADMGFILKEEKNDFTISGMTSSETNKEPEEAGRAQEPDYLDTFDISAFIEDSTTDIAEEEKEPIIEPVINVQSANEDFNTETFTADTTEAFTDNLTQVEPEKPAKEKHALQGEEDLSGLSDEMSRNQQAPEKAYVFPPLDLLAKPKGNAKGISEKDLKETAAKLQSTLESFGVGVKVTNVSCGPSVTRYELLPEQGVKVSRITGLADDIKLNLAAADIRIEAPIPGKAAVGIEVPNKDNSTVLFRELLDSKDFKEHPSDIAFAVGKDIGGQTVVTDIGKMPHLLIAGATGSGKSVCINTLIMSILYKAKPSDVKMIMVDPKVVELSVYNGIPHLLIPVVTDPKKASAALNWAVMEMTERYKKFADLGVRDVKGYNEKVAQVEEYQDEKYQKLPQIVIIVDELADLMMVAPGEVEDAICRLAQMARAAGLHLIIATQRPSVNVITGLIKANIPSRIAFSVSSAIDSRTIIDGSGAEKLLGKGDMLFFPSGYPKPVRVQGAFISDKEVSEVVRFLTEENSGAVYNEDVVDKIANAQITETTGGAGGGSERDDYFIEAGKFIIDKDKASIGMLQRVYKIGFNRAARIMDQLAEAGVVGPEEGTKPRKILMSLEEFEQYVDEYY